MVKRLFEVLDEMNVEDAKKGTRLVSVSSNFISANKIKQGAKIEMGVPEDILFQLASDKVIAVLLIVDKEEYFKRSK